jgi:DNA adenine methylase
MVTRPALRYHGGKWRLAPWIISHFPAHRVYTEAYGGGASVLLRKPRSYAEVYNDLDGEIVSLFRVLRNPAQARELIRLVKLTPFAREEHELSYLIDGDPIEQARRTLIRSFMGFGSDGIKRQTGFRGNVTRTGTTPALDWSRMPPVLEQIVERLQGVVIEHMPALDLIAKYDNQQTLHYVDPPYPHATRGDDNRYRHEMTDVDHRQLAECLARLKGAVIVSGYPCALYDDELFGGWRRVERSTHADGGRDRVEVLWLSPGAAFQGNLYAQ